MSARFLWRGVVLAGVMLLAVGLAAAQRPGAKGSGEENPFDAPKKAQAKPAPQPAKKAAKAAADPFGAREPVDPFADRKPDVKPTAKGPTPSGRPKGRVGKLGSRGVVVESGAAEAAIEKALAETVEGFEFDQTPLANVIDQLHKQYKINIVLDSRALEGMSIDPSTEQVTISLKGISLRSALNLMLAGKGLTWTIHAEVLYITTPDEEQSILTTRVYDVADLVRYRDEKDAPWDNFDPLIEAIEQTISPDSWQETGAGSGAISGEAFGSARVLIVSQTYRLHIEVVKLLEDLRKVVAKAGSDQKPPLLERPKGGRAGPIYGGSSGPPRPPGMM